MILLTGAGGKTGRTILRSLWQRDEAVRCFVRNPVQAERVETLRARFSGQGECFVGDLTDSEAVSRAAASVRAIYHICPNFHPAEETIGEAVILAAEERGVERFVFHSVLHPAVERMPHHWRKMRVEERLFESSLSWTVLQPAAYLQNLRSGWSEILEGELRVPYPPQTELSMVDLEDVAEVATAVLFEKGHQGAIYELVGTLALSQAELAERLERVLARPVRVVQISLDDWVESARSAALGEAAIDDLMRMFQYYTDCGFGGNPRVLGTLLGREPRSLEDYAAGLRGSGSEG